MDTRMHTRARQAALGISQSPVCGLQRIQASCTYDGVGVGTPQSKLPVLGRRALPAGEGRVVLWGVDLVGAAARTPRVFCGVSTW